MDAVGVAEAVMKHRLPIFCATCVKFKEGRAQGLPLPECTSRKCGSPIARMDFPDYEGPIPKANFAQWCFVCGGNSDMGVRVQGSRKVFGICTAHAPMLDELEAVGANGKAVEVDLLTKSRIAPASQVFRRKKSLGQAIAEAEKDFTEDGE